MPILNRQGVALLALRRQPAKQHLHALKKISTTVSRRFTSSDFAGVGEGAAVSSEHYVAAGSTTDRERTLRRALDVGGYEQRLPPVAQLRPSTPWPQVAAAVSQAVPGQNWNGRMMSIAVRSLVISRVADARLLNSSA